MGELSHVMQVDDGSLTYFWETLDHPINHFRLGWSEVTFSEQSCFFEKCVSENWIDIREVISTFGFTLSNWEWRQTFLDPSNSHETCKTTGKTDTLFIEASRIDINNKLVQLLFYQLKEGFPFVVMDLKFIILSGYKTFYLKRTLNSFEKGFKG